MGRVAWSPHGDRFLLHVISFGEAPDEKDVPPALALYLVEVESGERTEIASHEMPYPSADIHPFIWEPDGSRFALTTGSTVRAFDSQGQHLWSTDLPARSVRNPRWSPDGRFISVHADEWSGEETDPISYAVYVLQAGTGEVRHVFHDAVACWGETWTANGEGPLVWQVGDQPGHVLLDLAGSQRRLPDEDPFFAEASPTDSDLIAYLGREELGEGHVGAVKGPLMVWSVSQGDVRPVAEFGDDAFPDWDPNEGLTRWLTDGRLALSTRTGGGHGGCIMP